jgi:hypothetical protein
VISVSTFIAALFQPPHADVDVALGLTRHATFAAVGCWNARACNNAFGHGLPDCLPHKARAVGQWVRECGWDVVVLQEAPAHYTAELTAALNAQPELKDWAWSGMATPLNAHECGVVGWRMDAWEEAERGVAVFDAHAAAAAGAGLAFARPPLLKRLRRVAPAMSGGGAAAGGAGAPASVPPLELALLSVHLKSVDPGDATRTQAEAAQLHRAVAWAEGRAHEGAPPVVVLLGDFNLLPPRLPSGGGGEATLPAADRHWADLVEIGLRPTLPPGVPTNMWEVAPAAGPQCYDNAWLRPREGLTAECAVVPALAADFEGFAAVRAAIAALPSGVVTPLVGEAVSAMIERWRGDVMTRWSDHKPLSLVLRWAG